MLSTVLYIKKFDKKFSDLKITRYMQYVDYFCLLFFNNSAKISMQLNCKMSEYGVFNERRNILAVLTIANYLVLECVLPRGVGLHVPLTFWSLSTLDWFVKTVAHQAKKRGATWSLLNF